MRTSAGSNHSSPSHTSYLSKTFTADLATSSPFVDGVAKSNSPTSGMSGSRFSGADVALSRFAAADVAGTGVFWSPGRRLFIMCPIAVLLVIVTFVVLGGGIIESKLLTMVENKTTETEVDYSNDVSYGAICLTGSARDFELTGLSIEKYLLSPYQNESDVFINAVMDGTAHKLTIFENLPNLAVLKVSSQIPLLESGAAQRVFRSAGSPRGIQGLLQMFNLVEGCLEMIEEHSRKTNKKYQWIIRTRLDTFWNERPPRFKFVPNSYFIPQGSKFLGLNDRFGAGLRIDSFSALRRLSILNKLDRLKYEKLNSEKAFQLQLGLEKISAVESSLHFCVLSRRNYPFPPDKWGLPVLSITGKGAGNGAKCRPCKPVLPEEKTKSIINQMVKIWGWPGNSFQLEMCADSRSWDPEVYDELVGPEWANVRKKIINRSFIECKKDFKSFRNKTPIEYRGPSPAVICQVAEWGSPHEDFFTLPVFTSSLKQNSVVYSITGEGNNYTVERQIYNLLKCPVYVFTSVPFENLKATENQGLRFYTWESDSSNGLKDVLQNVTDVENKLGTGLFRALSIIETKDKSSTEGFLKKTMGELSHKFIDLLIVSTNSSSGELPLENWSDQLEKLPVCQIIVRFTGSPRGFMYNKIVERITKLLQRIGFDSIHCLGNFGSESCTFVRQDGCRTV